MPVEPTCVYTAYCDLNDGIDEDDPAWEDNLCDWSWTCDTLQDDGDCEIELSIHMLVTHGRRRELPYGYEYRQDDLDARLKLIPGGMNTP